MRSKAAAVALALAVAVGACGAFFEPPLVTLDGMSVQSLGLRGGTLVAHVHIDNPNGFELRSEGMRYLLEVAGSETSGERTWQRLAEGEFKDEVRVPARDAVTVPVPIDFTFGEMGGIVRALIDRGSFDYRVSGTVDVEDPVSRTVPYRHSGQVSLSGVR